MKYLFQSALALFLLLTALPSHGSHILGGHLSYKCQGNGLYEFTAVILRDCRNTPFNSAGFLITDLTLQGPHGTTSLPLVSSQDMTPRCVTGLAYSCNPPSTGNGNEGSYSRFIFRGTVDLSSLAPAPLNGGYAFYVTLPCCRPTINNSLADNNSQALQVRMYRYTDPKSGVALSPAELCDQSVNFVAESPAVYYANPNDTIYWQQMAAEADVQDSVVYGIEAPLSSTLIPYAYTFPYSLANPVPGLLGSPALPAANTPIHPRKGEMVFRPITFGTFVVVIRATSYRNGQKIGEAFNDVTFKVVPNPQSTASAAFLQRAPVVYGNSDNAFDLTYYVEDEIAVPVLATDYFPTLTGDPAVPSTWTGVVNAFSMVTTGRVVSRNSSSQIGCDAPPCLITNRIPDSLPPTNPTQPILLNFGNGNVAGPGYNFASEGGILLRWQPACNHVPVGAEGDQSLHKVLVTAFDEYCPLEGRSSKVVSFNIKSLPRLAAPIFQTLTPNASLTGFTLDFEPVLDTLSIDPVDAVNLASEPASVQLDKSVTRRKRSFDQYRVYVANSAAGPFTLLDSLDQLYSYSSTYTGLDLVNDDHYFYLTTVSSCGRYESAPSDTLHFLRTTTSASQLQILGAKIYPNPSAGRFIIETNEPLDAISVYDLTGRLIEKAEPNQSRQELNLEQHPKGVYLVALQQGDVVVYQRLVVK